MTVAERKEINEKWLKTVKTGDEICLTNTHNVLRMFLPGNLFGNMFGFDSDKKEDPIEEICKILTVRGILDDGSIVVEDSVYTPEGLPSDANVLSTKAELMEPTDELRDLAWKLKFQKDIRSLEWKRFPKECIEGIIKLINPEVEKMNEEAKGKTKTGQ